MELSDSFIPMVALRMMDSVTSARSALINYGPVALISTY
jgi:hypothetical protein